MMTQFNDFGVRQDFTVSFILQLVFIYFIYNTSAVPRRSLKHHTSKQQKIKLARKSV